MQKKQRGAGGASEVGAGVKGGTEDGGVVDEGGLGRRRSGRGQFHFVITVNTVTALVNISQILRG